MERRSVKRLKLLPDWLGKYVRYDNPEALPQIFTQVIDKTYSGYNNLQMLRMVLGMYPDMLELEKSFFDGLKQEDMQPWYQIRIQ